MADKENSAKVWLSPADLTGRIHISFRDDHVHVQIGRGYKIDSDNENEFWTRLKSVCERYGSRRVLVEGFPPSRESETAEIVGSGQRTSTVPHLWMAFSLEGFEPTERSELFATIAASQGVRVRFFSDSETALGWLKANAPA